MFTEGQEIWILQTPNRYRGSISKRIAQCVYRGKDKYTRDIIQFKINGKLGMSMGVTGGDMIFATLEELKTHLIQILIDEKIDLSLKINAIDIDIDYVKSLKDIKEDRENKLNEILDENI